MGISDKIEAFITELLKDDDDWLELRRNELASVFNCVPSQINYVISTRFTPEQGYMVESRRGGGGYLKIKRMAPKTQSIMQSIGGSLSYADAKEYISCLHGTGAADDTAVKLMLAAVSDSAINAEPKDEIRAGIFKSMLTVL